MGQAHQTVGSDILAISRALSLTEHLLGAELASRVVNVKPDQWYPIHLLLDALMLVESKSGPVVLRQVGRKLFESTHAQRVIPQVKSAADLIFSLDEMYHQANRGDDIGGWEVHSFQPGRAVLFNSTPHPCPLEEGILTQAFSSCSLPVFVNHTQCRRRGDSRCQYDLASVLHDERWHGGHPFV